MLVMRCCTEPGLRRLAALGAIAVALALLPATATAQTSPVTACPQGAPAAAFVDRGAIPPPHRANVDCAVHRAIVRGFADGTFRPRQQVRRDQMASFIALTLDAAGVALPTAQPRFTDVPASNVHAGNINRLAAAGIVEGGPGYLPAHQYGPGWRTRRDQMASFLMRAAGYALHGDVHAFDSTAQQFIDVPSGNTHFATVNAAATNGLAEGIGAGRFAPRAETRRDQMASFIVRLLGFTIRETQPPGPPQVSIALSPASGQPGTAVTATTTGDRAEVHSIGMAGPCVTNDPDVAFSASTGVFTFAITEGATEGTCPLTFTVTFTDQTNQSLNRTFTVTAPPAPAPGPVTLASTTVQRGGTLSGTVEDPATVQSLTATGCGHQNVGLSVSGTGSFSLLMPAATEAGACELTFTVRRTDGSVTTQTFGITVATVAPSITNGPDLIQARIEANPTAGITNVVYVFDSDASGLVPITGDFHIYRFDGTRHTPSNVQLIVTSATLTEVRARYTDAQVNNATVATVNRDALQDAAGNTNYWASAPLLDVVRGARTTGAPDLIAISSIQRISNLIVADFRFDEAVAPASYSGKENQFLLIAEDGTRYPGFSATNVTADNQTVRVVFEDTETVPIGGLRRAAVLSLTNPAPPPTFVGTVADGAGNVNVLQTVGVPGHEDGILDNRRPSLVSATVSGTNQVDYRFNVPVSVNSPLAGHFRIYDFNANQTPAGNAVRSSVDTRVVTATFPAGAVGGAVGASIRCFDPAPPASGGQLCADGAVFSTATGERNAEDEVALQGLQFQAGRTALPDLVSVTTSIDQFNDTRVVFTFDGNLQATGYCVAGQTPAQQIGGGTAEEDLSLVDSFATQFYPTAYGNCAGNRVVFDNAFTPTQVREAILGSVNDGRADTGNETNEATYFAGIAPRFPEAHAPILSATDAG